MGRSFGMRGCTGFVGVCAGPVAWVLERCATPCARDVTQHLGDCHKQMTAVGKGVQGNFDPTALYAAPTKVAEETIEMLWEAFGEAACLPTSYIANLGMCLWNLYSLPNDKPALAFFFLSAYVFLRAYVRKTCSDLFSLQTHGSP